jgi:predicted aspartyl protease
MAKNGWGPMPQTFTGFMDDLKPLIICRVWKAGHAAQREVRALIDTGATDCVVRPAFVKELGLELGPVVHSSSVGIAGDTLSTMIDVQFFRVDAPEKEYTHAITGLRTLVNDFHDSADVILGRNVLAHFKVVIDRGTPFLIDEDDEASTAQNQPSFAPV